MTVQELAKMIDGRDYRNETTIEIEEIAKESNMLIIFGASDDLVELRGAIDDEIGCYKSRILTIIDSGMIFDKEGVVLCEKSKCKYYHKYFFPCKDIENACDQQTQEKKVIHVTCSYGIDEYPWTFKVDGTTEYANFVILEDGIGYCNGVVIQLDEYKLKEKVG